MSIKRFHISPPVIQLALLIFLIFAVPFFPKVSYSMMYQVLFTAVIFVSVFALEKTRKLNLIIALIVIGFKWTILIYDAELRNISNIPQVIFFIWIVVRLLWQIANTRQGTWQVIVDCLNGYFLMALVSAILIGLTTYFLPGSFNFSDPGESVVQGMNDYIYHALVVFSTTGFGDIIPVTPEAKAVSNFISVSGQLYVAIIITLLIGHYSAAHQEADFLKREN